MVLTSQTPTKYSLIYKPGTMRTIKIAFCFVFILAMAPGFSQNHSINFIEKPWSEILTMAKNENKMIFLDAYTSWCGPCKWMAANMFTNDSIADFYNQKFICAHFDMEKGEGITLARTFQVKAYPTLLFINNNGEMVHLRVGAPQKVSDYFEMGQSALTPGEGFADFQRQFQAGNRNPAFMLRYFDKLQGAYMPVNEPLGQYFATISDQDLLTRDNWNIIYQFVDDMDGREFGYLQKHQAE